VRVSSTIRPTSPGPSSRPALRAGASITSGIRERSRRPSTTAGPTTLANAGSSSTAVTYSERRVPITHKPGVPSSAAASAARNFTRSSSSAVRSSSAWSTMSSADDAFPSVLPSRSSMRVASSAGSRAMRSRIARQSSTSSVPASLRASVVSGLLPGLRGGTTAQRPPIFCSRGPRPARTRDDLPLPEGPIRAMNRRDDASIGWRRPSNSSISASRPKKTAASSASSGDSPGNGGRCASHAKASRASNPCSRNPFQRRSNAASPPPSSIHSIDRVSARSGCRAAGSSGCPGLEREALQEPRYVERRHLRGD
jgi:hypothetical protein